MRLAIVSDLHANREAVEAVLEHAQRQQADRFALLGDFVGYGADPAWVVDCVRDLVSRGALAVQGNHDQAVAEGPAATMRADPRSVIEWTRGHLDASQIAFLARLPLAVDLGEIHLVHASAWHPERWEYIQSRVEALRSLGATAQRLTFCGHMHEPRLFHLSRVGKVGEFVPVAGVPVPLLETRRWLAIPGAAGQPRDGDPAACYALFDDATAELTFWRVPYDHDHAADKIRAAGLPQALAARLVDGH